MDLTDLRAGYVDPASHARPRRRGASAQVNGSGRQWWYGGLPITWFPELSVRDLAAGGQRQMVAEVDPRGDLIGRDALMIFPGRGTTNATGT